MIKDIVSAFCILSVFILFGIGLGSPIRADAHKVVVFGWVEDGRIHVEAGFGSGRPAKNCKVDILDPAGSKAASGRTDMSGKFSCDLPGHAACDLTIRLDAGTGHLGQWVIKKEEWMKPAGELDAGSKDSAGQKPDNQHAGPEAQDLSQSEASPEETFRKMEAQPSWGTILTGVGIIFGLAFSAAFMRRMAGRKRSGTKPRGTAR